MLRHCSTDATQGYTIHARARCCRMRPTMKCFPSKLFILSALLLAACGGPERVVTQPSGGGEMEGVFYGELPTELYVDPATVKDRYAEFVSRLASTGPGSANKRPLYEHFVPIIGANGVLDGITQLWPTCHSEAHDLGKVIYASVKDIDTALRICRDGCYSGCMHGVMMEAYAGARNKNDAEGHVDVDVTMVRRMMNDMCNTKTMKESYSPGDCAHATGHALMVLAEYDVGAAISWCDEFPEDHMRYYCATGAYMEYVTEKDAEDVAAKKPILYPCLDHKYPGACARYKMVHVIPRLVRNKADVAKMQESCKHLKDPYRLGCYHGVGNGFMSLVASKQLNLGDVCGRGDADEKKVCVEGVMERMAKFGHDRAAEVCSETPKATGMRETCEASVERGMYDMQKDLSLYL